MTKETAGRSYATDFIETAKARCFETLDGLQPLEQPASK